ncbi:MAG: hypothetical protein HY538_03640 [Deltaproteobacteria bacterium]|nr:hypothetical protein [Deltaproteobacteria bacterium]
MKLFTVPVLIASLFFACGGEGGDGGGSVEAPFNFTQNIPPPIPPETISGSFHVAMTLVETNCAEEIAAELPLSLEGMFIVDEQEDKDIYIETVLNKGGSLEYLTAEVYGNSMVYSDRQSQTGNGCRYESTTSVVIAVDSYDAAANPLTAKYLNGTLLGSFEISGSCGGLESQNCKVGYRISGLGVHMKEFLTSTVSAACRFSEMLGFESEEKEPALEGSSHALKMVPEGFSLNLKM